MRRSVYLFELDSVRNSKKEIQRGQQALFEEIVKKGNTVVLSFNQLTDSEAFLCAIRDEKAYEQMVQLFALGAIKISRYGDVRTPSQYIQNAIDKCNDSSKEEFLFSGLPVRCAEKDLLEKMKHALQYSDTTVLEELMENEKEEEKKKDLEYVIRFVRMILMMSLEKISGQPANTGEKRNFMQFYEEIVEILRKPKSLFSGESGRELEEGLPKAIEILERTKKELYREDRTKKLMNNRTNWIKKLVSEEKTALESQQLLAKAVVDLCYNYTVEESIYQVSKHYEKEGDTFERDLTQRLMLYWKECKERGQQSEEIELPPWDTAVRVVEEERKRDRGLQTKECIGKRYEEDCEKEKRRWNLRIAYQMFARLRTALLYIVIFCGVDYFMGFVEDQVMGLFFDVTGNEWMRMLWSMVCSTIMFGIVGSVVANVFQLPDILESVRSIGVGMKDLYRIGMAKSGISYQNPDKERNNERKI